MTEFNFFGELPIKCVMLYYMCYGLIFLKYQDWFTFTLYLCFPAIVPCGLHTVTNHKQCSLIHEQIFLVYIIYVWKYICYILWEFIRKVFISLCNFLTPHFCTRNAINLSFFYKYFCTKLESSCKHLHQKHCNNRVSKASTYLHTYNIHC